MCLCVYLACIHKSIYGIQREREREREHLVLHQHRPQNRRVLFTQPWLNHPSPEACGDCDGRQGLVIPMGPLPARSGSQDTTEKQHKIMMGDKDWLFSRSPATPSGSQATRRETRGDCDRRQGFAVSRGPVGSTIRFSRKPEVDKRRFGWEVKTCPLPIILGSTIRCSSYRKGEKGILWWQTRTGDF